MCFSSRIVAVNISAAMSSSEDQQKLPGHRMCNWTFGSVLMLVWPLGTQAPMQIRLRSTKRKRGHENAHSVMCVRCCRWTTCHMSMHLKACFVHCRLIALEPAFSLSFHIWLCLSFCIQFAIGNLVWAADSNIFAVRIFICSLPSVRSLCTVCIESLSHGWSHSRRCNQKSGLRTSCTCTYVCRGRRQLFLCTVSTIAFVANAVWRSDHEREFSSPGSKQSVDSSDGAAPRLVLCANSKCRLLSIVVIHHRSNRKLHSKHFTFMYCIRNQFLFCFSSIIPRWIVLF